MAQNISGTSLLANSQAASATPCFRVRFDWSDLGFGSIASWTDESARIKSMSGESRLVDMDRSPSPLGASVSSVAHVVLDNEETTGFRFSPTNPNGPLYAYIQNGLHLKRCRIELGYKASGVPEYAPVLTGYLTGGDENYTGRTVDFEIRDRSSAAALTRASTELYADVGAQTYIALSLGLIDRDPPGPSERVIDAGIVLHPFAWLDDERVWDELKDLAQGHGGRVWFDNAGVFRFESLGHLVRPQANSWKDPTVSQYTFTVNRFQDCEPQTDPASVINHVVIEASPLYRSVLQTVYKASEVYAVPPGGSLTVKARHRWPADSVLDPVAGVDYVALTAGAVDITANVSIVRTSKATSSELAIANNNANYTAFLYTLQLRGAPILTAQPVRVEIEDAASIAAYGRRTETFKNPYIQGRRHAEALAGFVLARCKVPPLTLALRGAPAAPWLECGDRVTVQEALTGVNADFFITAIRWDYDGGMTQNLDLIKASALYPYSDYFQIGTSAWGTGTGKGRLMW